MKIYILGDSTAADKTVHEKPMSGWGEYLASHLDYPKSNVINLAVNGQSTKSYINERRLDHLLTVIQKDDLVLIQFAHNDEKKEDITRFTLPFDTFQTNIQEMIAGIRSREGTPILLTPIPRRKFEGKRLVDTHGDYLVAIKLLAQSLSLAIVDINAIVCDKLTSLGIESSKQWFLHLTKGKYPHYPDGLVDDTHFSELGANVIAELIADELKKKVIQ